MADDKGEKAQTTPQRVPADQLLLSFLSENSMVIIVDEVGIVQNTVKDTVYTVDRRPRVRVYYKDQVEKKDAPNPNGEVKPELVEVSN